MTPEAFKDISDGKYLNVADFMPAADAHGPGRRATVWLQGCLKSCPGCINPHMLDINKVATKISTLDLAQKVVDSMHSVFDIEGITIQGGEPMLQAWSLSGLLARIHALEPSCNVLIFTGYTLDFLRGLNSPHINMVLGHTDTLIDGEFIKERFDGELIRGSTNQKIHHIGQKRLVGRSMCRAETQDLILCPASMKIVKSGIARR